ncbi:MAG: hypothetical protein MI784_01225, partial [Cytophagales bacterium]|nr:hypothetical protein [Cytophagales bacterium]
MKKTIINLAIFFASLLSCNAQKVGHDMMSGTFYCLQKGKDFNISYKLELKSDSTFFLIIGTATGKPQCKGKWKIVDGEFIYL